MTKRFHIGAVLSITGERLVAPMDDVYAILNFLTNSELWTHQLPNAARKAKPWVLQQYPALASVDDSGVTRDNWREWLAKQVEQYGETLEIEQMPPDDQLTTNPFRDIPAGKQIVIVDGEARRDH